MRLAILGMGRMGHALAERLLSGGHELTVWNRTPHKADDLAANGAREAPTPAAAEGNEAAFTSLADDTAVRTVVTGRNGVAAASATAFSSTRAPCRHRPRRICPRRWEDTCSRRRSSALRRRSSRARPGT